MDKSISTIRRTMLVDNIPSSRFVSNLLLNGYHPMEFIKQFNLFDSIQAKGYDGRQEHRFPK